MVPYQLGLFVGLWIAWRQAVAWRRGLIGLAALLLTQPLVLILVGEWVSHTGMEPHVAAIRAWSVVGVLACGAWIVGRPRKANTRRSLSSAEPQHG